MNSSSQDMSPMRAGEILRKVVPWALDSMNPRYRKNHKGLRGRIGVVGGTRDYAGAPYFAAMSAMKLGADMSYVICSKEAGQVIKGYSPDLIVVPLLDDNTSEFENEMSCLLNRLHALVIGPGLGRERRTLERAKKLIIEAKNRFIPIVMDADILLLIQEDPGIIKSYPKALLTPNRIELQRLADYLYGTDRYELRTMTHQSVKDLVKRCASDLDVTILAKGPIDVIANRAVGAYLSTNEHSGSNRRCGGQGDITAGLSGVLMHWIDQACIRQDGQRMLLRNHFVWAAYIAAVTTRHCNELAYKEFRNGMMASNMIDKIPKALDSILGVDDSDVPIVNRSDCVACEKFDKRFKYSGSLSTDEITRYRRQVIMDEFGAERQIKLRNASVIIVGGGGLGCPAAAYLGSVGVGRIGLVDHDVVELSNLHRQILHSSFDLGLYKTESIKQSLLEINPYLRVDCHTVKMTRLNAVKLIKDYDVVVDATDNVVARYLINDACVVAKKPLVSGAALKMNGQLTVYNYDEETPCFRCVFPEPPPAGAIGSCSESGVLGVIPGIIGVQQALEAIKIAAGLKPAYARKMLVYDGELGHYREVTLAPRKPDCVACGPDSTLKEELIDYEEFCRGAICKPAEPPSVLGPDERITTAEYRLILDLVKSHILVDVRPEAHSNVSRFEHALQIPVIKLMEDPEESVDKIKRALEAHKTNQVYVVCRRGIASQRGAQRIKELLREAGREDVIVKDIIGGMTGWSQQIDHNYACL